MSTVRVLVGTRKGAFVLTSDGARKEWSVDGPHFAGWEVFHMKGSPADPDRIFAAPNGGGKTWNPVGNDFKYAGEAGTHQWYDGTPHPWEFARVWHLEPAREDPDTVYAGVEDAALFRSTDNGESWRPINRGLRSGGIPDEDAEVGHCVHRIAMHPARPGVLFMQKHWDVMRSDDAGESWREISGNLPSRRPSTSCRSRATPSTIRPTPGCACAAAAAAATSGRR